MERYSQFGTYIKYKVFDEFLSVYENRYDRKVKTLHIFVDLQNCLKGQYYEDFILETYNGVVNKEKYSPIVYDTINFMSRTRSYFALKNIETKFIIYWDSGKSLYHTSIDKNYKSGRGVSSTTLPIEVFRTGLDAIKFQKKLLNKIANQLNGVHVVFLENIETDFVPHSILRTHKNLIEDKSNLNLLLSADKDLFQTVLLGDNVFQYVKINSNWVDIISKNKVVSNLIKKSYGAELSDYFMVLFTLGGDGGDDIPSVIPRKRYLSLYSFVREYKDELKSFINDLIYTKQFKILDISKATGPQKKIVSLLNNDESIRERWIDNYFLMSFDILHEFINNKVNYTKLKHLTSDYKTKINKAIIEVFDNTDSISFNELQSIMEYCHNMESIDSSCINLCKENMKNNVDQGQSS